MSDGASDGGVGEVIVKHEGGGGCGDDVHNVEGAGSVLPELPEDLLHMIFERLLPLMAPVAVFKLSEPRVGGCRRFTAQWRWKLWAMHRVAGRLMRDPLEGTMWHSLLLRDDDGDRGGAEHTIIQLMLLAELRSWAKARYWQFFKSRRLESNEALLLSEILVVNNTSENMVCWCDKICEAGVWEVACVMFLQDFDAGKGGVGMIQFKFRVGIGLPPITISSTDYIDQPPALSVWKDSERVWHAVNALELSPNNWTNRKWVHGFRCLLPGILARERKTFHSKGYFNDSSAALATLARFDMYDADASGGQGGAFKVSPFLQLLSGLRSTSQCAGDTFSGYSSASRTEWASDFLPRHGYVGDHQFVHRKPLIDDENNVYFFHVSLFCYKDTSCEEGCRTVSIENVRLNLVEGETLEQLEGRIWAIEHKCALRGSYAIFGEGCTLLAAEATGGTLDKMLAPVRGRAKNFIMVQQYAATV
jgi:hypothetical protein